jgi:NADPH:quinone reductase-like Zn-dependent oxidoreductase
VTGVCSTRNLELVRSIGADEVFDRTAEDPTRSGRQYDVVLDIAGSYSASACRRVLTREGTYVVIGGQPGRWLQPAGHTFAGLAQGPFVSQKMLLADAVNCKAKRARMETLTGLLESGQVKPVLDRRFSFAELPAALEYQERGQASGKVTVAMVEE